MNVYRHTVLLTWIKMTCTHKSVQVINKNSISDTKVTLFSRLLTVSYSYVFLGRRISTDPLFIMGCWLFLMCCRCRRFPRWSPCAAVMSSTSSWASKMKTSWILLCRSWLDSEAVNHCPPLAPPTSITFNYRHRRLHFSISPAFLNCVCVAVCF